MDYNKFSFIPNFYVVGGYVRDLFLEVPPNDMDIASPLPPEEFMELCKKNNIKCYPTGIKHGTVSFIIDNELFEHTTFRKDVETDGRHAKIEYAKTIEEDLARRDFTINSMAINPDRLVDPYSGVVDCINRVVRTSRNPLKVMEEDFLRILRAARIAARFRFEIEPSLQLAMKYYAFAMLRTISVERIFDEFDKALKGPNPSLFLKILFDLKILQKILPEFEGADLLIHNPIYHKEGSVWNHILECVERAPVHLRWAAFLHDVGKMKTFENMGTYCRFPGHDEAGAIIVENICKRLKMYKITDELIMITKWHTRPMDLEGCKSKYKARKFQFEVGSYLPLLKEFMYVDAGDRSPNLFAFGDYGEVKPLIKGDDVLELGYRGKEVGEILSFMHQEQLARNCDRETLLRTLRKKYGKGINS